MNPYVLNRRRFFKTAGITAATTAITAVPMRSPAPSSIMEAAAALCVVLTVTAVGVVIVVRLCRPRYILYYSVNEDKPTNSGRDYICLSCSKAEAQQKDLTPCQGPKFDLSACQAIAAQANTNWEAVACGPISTDPALRASITLQSTKDPDNPDSWQAAAPSQAMDLNEDGAQVTFNVPRFEGNMFFRTSTIPA